MNGLRLLLGLSVLAFAMALPAMRIISSPTFYDYFVNAMMNGDVLSQPQQGGSQWEAPILNARRYFDKNGGVQYLIQGQASATTALPRPQFDMALEADPSYVRGHKIVRRFPHDSDAFTQGLFISNGTMYESTGLYGKSSVRKVDIQTGKVLQISKFTDDIFGEGITMHQPDNKLYGLSWHNRKGFRIHPQSLTVEKEFVLPSEIKEGWGITSDGKQLLVTDSTETLYFMDTDFNILKKVGMQDPIQNTKLAYVNEVEFIDGKLYGNVYGLDHLAVIDPSSGNVLQWIDCRGLWTSGRRGMNAVFNGIAYDSATKKLFVTGKNWPDLYEIAILN